MPRLSVMPAPVLPLSGLELVPLLQGGGPDGNVGLPLLAAGQLPRGNVLALRAPMLADLSATADADPGAGKVRFNHATLASATILFIDDVDTAAGDLSGIWAGLHVGGFVYLQASVTSDARDNWQRWQITAVTDAAGYAKIGVTLQSSHGTFADGDALELTLQQPTPLAGVDRNVVTALATSGVVTVDCSLGDYFTITPTAAVTGWSFINVPPGCSINIVATQGVTPYSIVMPAAKWAGGIAGAFSATAGKVDELSMSTSNSGGPWRAVLGKAFA